MQAARRLRQVSQPFERTGGQHLLRAAPAPVAVGPARHVHPGLGAQVEQVLKRRDRERGHGFPRQRASALAPPRVQRLRSARDSSTRSAAARLTGPHTSRAWWDCRGCPCTRRCWQRNCGAGTGCPPWPSKANWRTRMPGRWNLIAQRGHVGRDQPQVLGDEGQGAEALLDGLEELGARASDPLARLGRRGSRRHVPGRRERAEMIQPDHVHLGQQRAKAVDAPAISALRAERPSRRRGCPRAARPR